MATTDRYILEIETAAAERNLDNTKNKMGGLGAAAGRLKGLIGPIAAGLAGIAAVQGIGNKITEMDDLAKAARNAGAAASPETFEGFQVARNLLGEMGLSAAESDRAFKNMTTRLAEAADTGKGPAADAFAKLKDQITDTNGNLVSTPELFEKVTQALQDGTLSMTDARKILGDVVGPKILGGFDDLASKGITAAEAMADVKENSDIVDLEAANNAEAFGDTMGRLQEVAGRLGTEIVTALLPVLNQLAEGALEMLPGIIDFVKEAFTNLEPVFQLIGNVLTEVVLPVLGKLFEILGTIAQALAPLIDAVLPAFKAAFEFVATAIEFVVDKIIGFIETLGRIKESVTNTVAGIKEGFGSMTDGITSKAKQAYEGVTGWFGQMYDEVVGNSIVPDMAKGVLSSFSDMASGMINYVGEAINGVKTTMSNLGSAVSNKFEEITGISLNGLQSQVSTMGSYLTSAVNNLTSSISSKLSSAWNSVSNTASRISSSFGNIFGGFDFGNIFSGFFANGGNIPAGTFGVVGERGPELVTGPANVTPLNNGLGTSVTYNINAVDASSFRNLLARDPEFVHRVVQRGATTATQGRR